MAGEFPALRANEYRDAWCGQVLPDRVDSAVRVAGWVHRRRDHGGLIFIDLRDRTGLVQLVFDPDDTSGPAFGLGHKLRAEDVLSATGQVVRRSDDTVNPKMATGEVEIRVKDAELLADSENPPLEIETPVLTRSTPEGARDFLVPSRLRRGSFFALPQSPQLFKQLLMVGGFERYFQIARCFRDEDSRADRQLDFTQLDIEMSFVDVDDIIDMNERMLAAVLAEGGIQVELPMRRIPYDEAISRYGTDKPDLRFGLELAEVTDVFGESEFT